MGEGFYRARDRRGTQGEQHSIFLGAVELGGGRE